MVQVTRLREKLRQDESLSAQVAEAETLNELILAGGGGVVAQQRHQR